MTTDLYTALAKANETIKNPTKDAKGNYGAYLTLDALLEAVRAPLAAQGLSIVQDVTDDDERIYVTTRIVHASGQEATFGPMSSPRGQNIQHAGAAVTYLRRFTLGAALGVAGEADDDGQGHADQVKNPATSGKRVPASRGGRRQTPPSPAAKKYLSDLIDKSGAMRDPDKWQASARTILGGMAEGWDGEVDHLDADQVGYLIAAMKKYEDEKVTRSKPTAPEPDDWTSTIPPHERAPLPTDPETLV